LNQANADYFLTHGIMVQMSRLSLNKSNLLSDVIKMNINKDYLIEALYREVEYMRERNRILTLRQEHLIAYAIVATIIAIWGWMV
jgi:hypothetical protein